MTGGSKAMRRTVPLLMLALIAATPAHAQRYAISCNGKSYSGVQRIDQPRARGSSPVDLKNIVYVIDEGPQSVHRYIERQKLFDDECGLKGMTCTRSFSADRVTLHGAALDDQSRTTTTFDWDRKTNRLTTTFDVFAHNGVGMTMTWEMRCKPADIPPGYVPTE